MKKMLFPFALLAAALSMLSCAQAPQTNTANANTNAAPAPSATAAPDTAAKKAPTDLEQLAQRLVTQSAGVKEGDVVLVTGGTQDQELLEDIAVNVRKVGAFPLVSIDSDRMDKRMYADVPDKYDTQANQLGMKLADIVNVSITVDSNLTEGLFADTDPKRLAARAKADAPINEEFIKRNVRQVEVGNGFYPTDWRARRFGMSLDDLTKTFWDGVNTDYATVQSRGEQVKGVLSAGNELHITNPNGTDLKMKVQGRPVLVSDGIISPEDAQKGGGAVSVYLPAGEVFCAPVAGTVEGKVVHTLDYYNGKEIDNLTLTVAGGKVTAMTGSGPGFDQLKAAYDVAGDGKDVLSFVDLGINPNVKLPASSKLGAFIPAGTITVGLGNNEWAGGDDKSPYAYTVFLPGSTVTLDDKTIIEGGQLKI
ncbi:MAG TPA: aminopeptidase [Pyrinomonadaceae bacterium]|nr:aminopeptidase [Pyrinomonadaceae bacterium]